MSVKHIFLETMFDDFTPDSVSREELISILLDDLMVVARDNLSIEYLENGATQHNSRTVKYRPGISAFTAQMDCPLVAATSPYQNALSFGMRCPVA